MASFSEYTTQQSQQKIYKKTNLGGSNEIGISVTLYIAQYTGQVEKKGLLFGRKSETGIQTDWSAHFLINTNSTLLVSRYQMRTEHWVYGL